MADYDAAREMDDVVHRLLPPEIFADIGIVVATPPSCAVSRSDHAVVEELAARLACILGLDGTREQRAPPTPPYVRGLQGRRRGVTDGSGALVGANSGGGHHGGMAPGSWSGTTQRLLPRFEPAVAPFYVDANYHHPPARCRRGGGTGVFLPRAEAYLNLNGAPSTSASPRNGAKPPRMLRKEAAMMPQQLQLRAMVAEMEKQKREAFAAAFQLQGCPALALRQQ